MRLKLLIISVVAAAYSVGSNAQSCDALYPSGHWQTEDGQAPYYVDLWIDRESKPNDVFNNRVGCGSITIFDNNTDKQLFKGQLLYSGKKLSGNMPTGVYDFKVISDKGETCFISVNRDEPNSKLIVGATGALTNHKAFGYALQWASKEMWYEDVTEGVKNEKELLNALREAVREKWDKSKTPGFDDLPLFIQTHERLDPSKPKYASPKGTVFVNIREKANFNASKIGELAVGTSIPVVDEFNGWCQVRMGENKFGWVSLSVVTLSNTGSSPSAASSASDDDQVYEVVEQMPLFPGGQNAMMTYLSRNIHYPPYAEENSIQGRVLVGFVVEKDGSIGDVKIVKSIEESLDCEAKRVIQSMPKWTPGSHEGKFVRVKYTIPITFRLNGDPHLFENGHMAFMGVSLAESPTAMKSKLLAKGLTVRNNMEDGSGNCYLTNAIVNGVKSHVSILQTLGNKVGSVVVEDMKTYLLPEAKTQFQARVQKVEAIYGKGVMETNENNYKVYVIKKAEGVIRVCMANEDEMDGASDFWVIRIDYEDKK